MYDTDSDNFLQYQAGLTQGRGIVRRTLGPVKHHGYTPDSGESPMLSNVVGLCLVHIGMATGHNQPLGNNSCLLVVDN